MSKNSERLREKKVGGDVEDALPVRIATGVDAAFYSWRAAREARLVEGLSPRDAAIVIEHDRWSVA